MNYIEPAVELSMNYPWTLLNLLETIVELVEVLHPSVYKNWLKNSFKFLILRVDFKLSKSKTSRFEGVKNYHNPIITPFKTKGRKNESKVSSVLYFKTINSWLCLKDFYGLLRICCKKYNLH